MYELAIDTEQGAGRTCLCILLLQQPLSIFVSTSLFLLSSVISTCLHQTLHSTCEVAVKRGNFRDGYLLSYKNNILYQHNEVVETLTLGDLHLFQKQAWKYKTKSSLMQNFLV